MDYALLNWIQSHLRTPFLDGLMVFITHTGDGGLIWILLALLLFCYKPTRRMGLTMGLSLLFGLLFCNLTLKPLVGRLRPYVGHENWYPGLIPKPWDSSFPSGHSTASWSAAFSLFSQRQHRSWLFGLAVLYAALVSLSRLYLYVHFPTDVLAGLLLGLLDAFLAERLLSALESRYPRFHAWLGVA